MSTKLTCHTWQRKFKFIIVAVTMMICRNTSAFADSELRGIDASPPIESKIIATTTNEIDGYRVKRYLGIVRGVIVREPKFMQGLKADLKGIVGGKISPLIRMCDRARQEAYDGMMEKARLLEANAVVGVRYDGSALSSSDDDSTAEVACYGTAVFIEPVPSR